ncbi:MAG: hypothetical protein DRO65_04225, partial [Candidatus Altiarchaeales archaeon]
AKWALPEENIKKLEELLQKFTPEDLVDKNKILFDKWPYHIICQANLKPAEQRKIAEEKRKSALEEIWKNQGQEGIIRLIKKAKLPHEIGDCLAISSFAEEIEDIIFQWLYSEDKKLNKVAQSFIYRKFSEDKSYLQIIYKKYKSEWDFSKWAKFCLALPCTKEIIDFVEKLSPKAEKIYWENLENFYSFEGSKEDAEMVIKKLLKYNRPIAALNAASQYLYTICEKSGLDANLLAEILYQVAIPSEGAKDEQIDVDGIEKIFDYLQKSSEIDTRCLVNLEWLYISYFWHNRHSIKTKPTTLIKEILNNPGLFVQLIKWAFKAEPPIDGEFSDLSSEQKERLAENAYFLLNMIDKLPGKSGEDIDFNKLMEWITYVREKCTHIGCLPFCDETIGKILSHSPIGKDGIWPHEAVREVIEEISSKEMERGIEIGIYNQRGVVSKSLGEGGKQERELAEKYNQFAEVLKFKYPRTAAMLKRIAQGYIQEGRIEDLWTKLSDFL